MQLSNITCMLLYAPVLQDNKYNEVSKLDRNSVRFGNPASWMSYENTSSNSCLDIQIAQQRRTPRAQKPLMRDFGLHGF